MGRAGESPVRSHNVLSKQEKETGLAFNEIKGWGWGEGSLFGSRSLVV